MKVIGDHPRACGEKPGPHHRGVDMIGSPPRMRGKGCFVSCLCLALRITPAHAGKS